MPNIVRQTVNTFISLVVAAIWKPVLEWASSGQLWRWLVVLALLGVFVWLLVRGLWLGIQQGMVERSQSNVLWIKIGTWLLDWILRLLVIAALAWMLYAGSLLGYRQYRASQNNHEIERIANHLTPTQKSILLSAYTCSHLTPGKVKNAIMEDQISPIAGMAPEVGVPLLIYSGERLVEQRLLNESRYIVQEEVNLKLSVAPPKRRKGIGIACSITPLGLKVGKYLYEKYPALRTQ